MSSTIFDLFKAVLSFFLHFYLTLLLGRQKLLINICPVQLSAFSSILFKARFFLLVDLRDFFFRFRVGGGGEKEKISLKMTN